MNSASSNTSPAAETDGLQAAWAQTCQTGRAIRMDGVTLIVEVADEDQVKAVERLNLYHLEKFGKMLAAGIHVRRVSARRSQAVA